MLLDNVGKSEIFCPHLNVEDAVLFRDEDLFFGFNQKISKSPFLNIAAFR